MSKRFGEHTSLRDVLNDFIASNRLNKGLDKVTVEEAWHQLMGPAISKYTDKVILEGDTLRVRLSSSVLREELSYGKDKIIQMLNEEVGRDLIKKLVLQ